jgi:hypothetical protein
VVFHSGFESDDPRKLQFIKKIFPVWTFVHWKMKEYESIRELMLSSFIFGTDYIKSEYFVKLDADAFFTDSQNVFTDDDFKFDITGHKWGYTKPGWWIDKLDGQPLDVSKKTHAHNRIASFCCLHKTKFVKEVALSYSAGRLPVPSHDTVLWWHANKLNSWKAINVKGKGVNNNSDWRKIRESVCVAESHDNQHFNGVLLSKVQLEITTDCNLKCHNCDRCCGIAPDQSCMALSQIWKFVDESLALNHRWSRIDILGGEPTLYPKLPELWSIIGKYKARFPRCRVRFSTNGLLEFKAPSWVDIRNSAKSHRLQKDHTAFNSAPVDSGETDFKCCSVPWRCGLALSKHGFFVCGAGASISRVFGFDVGIKSLNDVTADTMLKQLYLCKYCGHSQVKSRHIPCEQEISASWANALPTYKNKVLSEY